MSVIQPTDREYDCRSDSSGAILTPPTHQQQHPHPRRRSSIQNPLNHWRSRSKLRFSSNTNNPTNPTAAREECDNFCTNPLSTKTQRLPPDSGVERIVQRLEHRNEHRIPVPSEVKSRFLRLCKNAAHKRQILEDKNNDNDANDTAATSNSVGTHNSISSYITGVNTAGVDLSSKSLACIRREDVIQIRKTIRLEVEGRTKIRSIIDSVQTHLGFRCHCKVSLHVLNRAVDLIDEQINGGLKKWRGGIQRSTSECTFNDGDSNSNQAPYLEEMHADNNNDSDENEDYNDGEWFYYKDFAFYSLKVESNYPWIRNAGVFSILTTFAFYFFAPILWCHILKDPNICPETANGYLSSFYFASATLSTVGYGDVTVFIGSDNGTDIQDPEDWRILIAVLFMILSLVVSVVGFQAGLDSSFHPFRRRLDIFGRRVYEILRDANVVKGADDKHEDITSRMGWSKFSQLAEICLTFLLLNLVGMFAVQLSLLLEGEGEGEDPLLSISWMKSFYWAVQTTTTIGYGDVEIPSNLRWFMLLYLSLSTYFVGSAFGKLGELSETLESMQRTYLWQQQEASYTMLADFSGRPDGCDGSSSSHVVDYEPEIDQFEFTIASLVLMGKITSEDVRPIIEKFKRLTGENSNKITSSDVSGPMNKKIEVPEEIEQNLDTDLNEMNLQRSSKSLSSKGGALGVGKKIAKAFREEILSSNRHVNNKNDIDNTLQEEEEKAIEYSNFRIPKTTHAIAIDDSKIQRKLLAKFFSFAGIPPDHCTVVGDGHDEIMGFEDYVVKFMEDHDGYVFLIVDENLDVVDVSSKPETISGSLCVENIRRRISINDERRMFALVRSANDSSSDIAIYNGRAHGFLRKAPIKREKVNETLAPLWLKRFPPSEFGESIGLKSRNDSIHTLSDDIACTPYDITQKLIELECLFDKNAHVTDLHLIRDQMHELKGDLLTLNSNISMTFSIGQINLIQATQSPETIAERWRTLRDHINDIIRSLEKNFRLPKNTYAIAIDDSKIQRKLLAKFFDFVDIPTDRSTIIGDGTDEIKGFEDFVVNFMQNHENDYVLMIVDENLDVIDESSNHEYISGSHCVDNIRKRLPSKLERRILALVRSANDSKSDISIYNTRAHGFLPKAPIRREKVNELLAPLWLKRFPPSEFGDSAGFDATDETMSITSEELACTPYDIAQKLIDIESLFKTNMHFTNWPIIHDQLHELKGDLLTLNSDSSMISILGMINLMLLGQNHSLSLDRWHALRDRIYCVINSLHSSVQSSEGQTIPRLGILKRTLTSRILLGSKSSRI